MIPKNHSDGLGGYYGMTLSLRLGMRKKLEYHSFYIFLILVFMSGHLGDYGRSRNFLSLLLALQRNNEIYKTIRCQGSRVKRSSVFENNMLFSLNCFTSLFVVISLLLILILLFRSGNVSPNPGPDSVNSSFNSVLSSDTSTTEELLSNHLSVMHLNIQSIVPKIDLIKGESEAYDVLVFTESWLKETSANESILIENFLPPFRRDRAGRPGGGVIIYVRNTLVAHRRTDLEINGLEAVWLEIIVRSKTILIGGFYRPPNSNNDYFDLIFESIDKAYSTNIADIIITGDFNVNMLVNGHNKMTDVTQQYNLKQLIQEPTHFTETSSSLIDLFLVRTPSNVLMSGVIDNFIPDQTRYHCPIILLMKFVRPKLKSFKRHIWNYNLADYDKFRQILYNINWENELNTEDVDLKVYNITSSIINAGKQAIPNKVVTIRPGESPWITSRIKKIIRKRKRTFRKFKKTKEIGLFEKYKHLRNTVVKEIRISKENYFDKLEKLINNESSNSKIFWKTSKQLLNLSKDSRNIPPLVYNNEFAESDEQKATLLNNYFSSQSSVNDENKILPPPELPDYGLLSSIYISVLDVEDALKKLDVNKASGPDLLSPRLLKEGIPILSKPLSDLFNSLLELGCFPSDWKKGNLTPIYKKDDRTQPSNYRPVSLLSNLGKLMERCIHKHVYNYITRNQLLTSFQSGFTQGDSTTFQLLHTYHTFCDAVDRGKEVRVVFCDISKAFDRVWHKGLLHKLANAGFSGALLSWFTSYLSDRQQRVVLNGASSDWTSVRAGVPQGSILGPLLFLIYINDIVKNIGCSIRLFADDTSLYIIVDTPEDAAVRLNLDLSSISTWANTWLVDFNPNKTTSMIISRKRAPLAHPPLFMNNVKLVDKETHKHLGLILSNDCTWTAHIKSLTQTAWYRLHLLRNLKFKLKRHALEKLYFAFIRPILEYSCSVWDNCSSENKKMLDSVHVEAARIITGGTKLCSIEKLFADLGWDCLQERRNKQKLVIMYKMIYGITPNYLTELVPPLVREGNPYRLRNSNNIELLHANTNLYFNSFLPSTIRSWNNLPVEIQQADSLQSFKFNLNRNLKSPPKYFYAGTRKGQILHARLRMDCSSLNSHLYRKNIVDTPSCTCGEFESSYHFFFHCPKYTNIRNIYLQDEVLHYSVHDFLFGVETASDTENETLFIKVQNYIINSKRFN